MTKNEKNKKLGVYLIALAIAWLIVGTVLGSMIGPMYTTTPVLEPGESVVTPIPGWEFIVFPPIILVVAGIVLWVKSK